MILRVLNSTSHKNIYRIIHICISCPTNAGESTLESLIANLANYPERDPARLIEAASHISESGMLLEKLEEYVGMLKAGILIGYLQ